MGGLFFELYLRMRYPFCRLLNIYWIDSLYELYSLRRLALGDVDGDVLYRVLIFNTSPSARPNTALILPTRSTVRDVIDDFDYSGEKILINNNNY